MNFQYMYKQKKNLSHSIIYKSTLNARLSLFYVTYATALFQKKYLVSPKNSYKIQFKMSISQKCILLVKYSPLNPLASNGFIDAICVALCCKTELSVGWNTYRHISHTPESLDIK